MAESILGKINYLTDAQYRKAKAEGKIDPNQIYMTPDGEDVKDYMNLEIGSVTTLPAGSQATAEITGTVTNPILNLGLPQGEKGATGDKGETGPTGPSPSTLDVLKAVYPVGSVYLSINNTNPSSIFGFGTWVKESGGYLYGCVSSVSNSDYTGLNTQSGGSGTSGSYSGTSGSYSGTSGSYSGTSGSTTLTADQMPKHRHTLHIGINTPSSLVKGYGLSYTSQTRYPGQFAGDTGGETGGNYMDETGGSKGHTHSIPSHTHSIPSHTHSIPSHTHSTPAHTHNVAHIGVFIWRRTA